MKIYILAVLFVAVQAKDFQVENGNTTCLMLSLNGTLSLEAKAGGENATKSLGFASATMKNTSTCTIIQLDMGSTVEVWFQFANGSSADMWTVTPVSQFEPDQVFPSITNSTAPEVLKAKPFPDFMKNNSFACDASSNLVFTATTSNVTYDVTASITGFKIQSSNIKDGKFSESKHCDADMSTTPAPTTTPPKTTPTPTTPKPHSGVETFTCKYKNTTGILLVANLTLDITYNTTKPGSQTLSFVVPDDASVVGAECNDNETRQSLPIKFFDDWGIQFDFTKDGSSYYVSDIKINYVLDTKYFPDALNANKTVSVMYNGSKTFLKADATGYYRCDSSTAYETGMVQLNVKNLKYMAFNKDPKKTDDFSGDVSECSADETTSSVVPIAVGAALAGLVVIVLIAYLIGRKRTRKSGYESV